MVTIKNEKIEMEEALKNKIEFICSFCKTTPIIYNGSIKMIEHTNLAYIEHHKLVIKEKIYFFFEECDEVFIDDLYQKIKMKDLEEFIKSNN